MKTIAFALALILAPTFLVGAILPATPKVEPWPRYEITGKLIAEESLVLFGAGQKRLWLADSAGAYHYLAFGCEKDYQQAERLIGQLVEADGYAVGRGYECWYVPVVLRERTKERSVP